MTTSKYDIIIIGAGPAGLACALELKNSPLSVLLIEKNKEIGPKVCAGGLTSLCNFYDIPNQDSRSFSIQHLILKDKTFKVKLEHPIRTLTREKLGEYQLHLLNDATNITILTKTSIDKIKDNHIITNDKKSFEFRHLVGADGSNSIVRKSLGLTTKHCIGLYYDVPIITDKCIWYLNQKKIGTGYIWVFPHKSSTNIGVFFNPITFNAKKAKAVLDKYLSENEYPFEPTQLKGAPICYNYEGYKFDNIYLTGDAAGLTSKGTGEGISYALMSGEEIAKMIKDHYYKPLRLEKMIKTKLRQDKLFKGLETFPYLHSFLYTIFIQLMRFKKFQSYFGI